MMIFVSVTTAIVLMVMSLGCSRDRSALSTRDAGLAPAIDGVHERLHTASQMLDACPSLRTEIARLDAHLDTAPASPEVLHWMGEALQLADEACPGDVPKSKYVSSASEGFERAKRLGWKDPPADEESCPPGRSLSRGEERAAAAMWREAADAYRAEIYRGCARELHWHGVILHRRGAARLGLARAAVELRDGLEARRQLRILDFERMGSTLRLGDKAEEERLWKRLAAEPSSEARAEGPEEAIKAFERAAFGDDAAAFAAMLARSSPDRALLDGARDEGRPCDGHVEDTRQRLLTCIALNLIPEAPRAIVCERAQGSARCRVTGAAGQVRLVDVVMEGRGFRVLSSEAAPP